MATCYGWSTCQDRHWVYLRSSTSIEHGLFILNVCYGVLSHELDHGVRPSEKLRVVTGPTTLIGKQWVRTNGPAQLSLCDHNSLCTRRYRSAFGPLFAKYARHCQVLLTAALWSFQSGSCEVCMLGFDRFTGQGYLLALWSPSDGLDAFDDLWRELMEPASTV